MIFVEIFCSIRPIDSIAQRKSNCLEIDINFIQSYHWHRKYRHT